MNDPVQGFDVSVSVVGPNGPELAGEYQEVEFHIKNNVEKYIETGERVARLLDGDIELAGKLKRGLMNVDIVGRVTGYGNIRRGTKIGPQPRYIIAATVNAPDKGLVGRIRMENAVITDLGISIKAGKTVVDKDLSFEAEGIAQR